MSKSNTQKKECAYYLTLFKIKDHTTWRARLKSQKDGFEEEWKLNSGTAEITDKMIIRIDRVTGTFSQ